MGLTHFFDSGLVLAFGLALSAFGAGFLAALSTVATYTTLRWDTLIALNDWQTTETLATIGALGLLALGLGLGWQWRRQYSDGAD